MTEAKSPELDVVAVAREARRRCWAISSDVSTATRAAQATCGEWQRMLKAASPSRFETEVRVSDTLRERFDVLDKASLTAYEMKVSANNPQHEFFKDVFKILEYNSSAATPLTRFVFLTEGTAVRRLRQGLARSVIENAHDLGFEVSLESLD